MAATLVLFGHDLSGPTANRPTNVEIGQMYFDTTLNYELFWNGSAWITPGGNSADAGTNGTSGGAGGNKVAVGNAGGTGTSGNGGSGGAVTDTSGAGGASSSGTGGTGGANLQIGGAGGASATGAGGVGGASNLTAGAGGAATAGSANGGAGGSLVLTPGAGGTSFGGAAGAAGGIRLEGIVVRKVPSVPAKTVTVTLLASEILTGLLTGSQGAAAAATYTLPTGTLLAAALPADFALNDSFDFTIVNISTNAAEIITVAGGTGTTLIGNATIAPNSATTAQTSGTFRVINTGTNTFNVYKIAG